MTASSNQLMALLILTELYMKRFFKNRSEMFVFITFKKPLVMLIHSWRDSDHVSENRSKNHCYQIFCFNFFVKIAAQRLLSIAWNQCFEASLNGPPTCSNCPFYLIERIDVEKCTEVDYHLTLIRHDTVSDLQRILNLCFTFFIKA